MPGDWAKSVHPDLVEDEAEQAAPEAPQTPPPSRGRGSRARASEPGEPAPDTSTEPATTSPQSGEAESDDQAPPEWLAQAREAFDKDPSEAFKLLAKNLPRDQIERDEVISGLVGSRADLRAKELLRQQERDAAERQKLELAQNNDLYSLGEITQRELQQRQQLEQAAASGSFMDGVVRFQQRQPEEVQRKVAGQTYGEGKGQAAGVDEYLQAIVDERIKLEKSELEREFQRRESALRKSVMSEVNGDEPVPEREGGTPGRVREVTDEQIAAMDLREYEALFDENGRPKPGVRHRATRSIPLTQR